MSTIADNVGLGEAWRSLLHPKIKELQAPQLPNIDCRNCQMVKQRGFASFARCCNIYPEFPNFLLGEILAKSQAPGSEARVEAWIDEGRSGPAFAHKSPSMHARHDDANYDDIASIPACPLLDEGGQCTVYHQRPSTCIEYNCTYPPYAEIIAFWHGYHSLLALYSTVASGYLLGAVGIDVTRFHETWSGETTEAIWEGKDALRPDFHEALWQGKAPKAFYLACYEHLQTHADSIHDELEIYRREQLYQQIKEDGTWSQSREDELLQLPLQPAFLEPTAEFWEHVASGQHLAPEDNRWTLVEFESIVLWLYQSMMGRYSVILKSEGA